MLFFKTDYSLSSHEVHDITVKLLLKCIVKMWLSQITQATLPSEHCLLTRKAAREQSSKGLRRLHSVPVFYLGINSLAMWEYLHHPKEFVANTEMGLKDYSWLESLHFPGVSPFLWDMSYILQ
jgi:hypothetical protein